jgi:Tfp pilus assembly protein PilO
MIWKEKRWLLAILGALLVGNLLFFVTYRVRFQQRVEALDGRLDQTNEQLVQARSARVAAEKELAVHRQIVTAVEQVYDGWWGTPEQRLAPLLIELRALAKRSGLIPRSISYDQSAQKKDGDTSELGISFGVSGSYDDIRRLINLLELTDQFVIIDEITLGQGGGSALTLNIRLRTLFRAPAAPVGGGAPR